MKIKIFAFFVTCLIVLLQDLFSQNLVVNGDFNKKTACPDKLNQLGLCENWVNANFNTPDYYFACDSSNGNWSNYKDLLFRGSKNQHQGFVGIITYNEQNKNFQEIIKGKLSAVLLKGKKYKFSIDIKLDDSSSVFNEQLFVSFVKDQKDYKVIFKNGYYHIKTKSYLTIKDTIGFKSKTWFTIEKEFIADGGETELLIGIFYNSLSKSDLKNISKKNHLTSGKSQYAYYFLDNVKVEEFELKK